MQTLVMSHQACMMCMHMHGAHSLSNIGTYKYLSPLACMQADTNLAKVTASHFWVLNVEKLQFSLFLISCCPEILNSTWFSWYLLLKIACLHVSFTAYENFYKLSKMHCLLVWFSTFQLSEVSENRDRTIKHISTYPLISSSISTYVIDLFLVILFT